MKRLWFLLSLILGAAAPARAQAPGITAVFPAGGQVGTTIRSTLSGSNLADVQAILVSGEGVRVEKGAGGSATACPVKLTIAPDAPVGLREIRLITPKGASNAGRIWVGLYPDVLEKEPNDARDAAQRLEKHPVTINGTAGKATDVDSFSFDAAPGETWVFSINSARHVSDMDGYLTLLDSRGRSLEFAVDTFGRDPRLVHTFEQGGRYTVQVRDTLFRGGPGYTYRLSVGRLPVVTRWSPMGGPRGSTVALQLKGVNLPQMPPQQVRLPDAPGAERLLYVPKTPAGPAPPIALFVTDTHPVPEQEPNNDPKSAVRLSALPAMASGWIDTRGDRDVFAFTAKEKQPVRLEVHARRLGSRLDSVLRVTDASGKELSANDDGAGRDARITFTPPAAGEYFVEVRSLSTRGGDEFFYQLEVGPPPAPDFRLTVTPDNPTIPAGAAVPITVTAQREGFAGEIALRFEGLPEGAAVSPAVMKPGQNSLVFTLTAPADAKPTASRLKVVGMAKIGEMFVERVAVGQERYQPPLTTNANQARMRDTEMIVGAVGAAPPYTLALAAPALAIPAGGKLEIPVKVARTKDYKEQIAVTVLGLPANVTAAALNIAGTATEGKLTLTAKDNAPVGPAQIVVQGSAKNVIVAVPATALEVQPKSAPPKKEPGK